MVKLSSLGDTIHALPAVRALKAASGAAIDWLVHPEYADIPAACPDVDRVIRLPRRGWLYRLPAWWADLRREHYDLAVDFQGLLKSALPMRITRAAYRLGPSFHREGAALFYDAVAAPRDKNRHAVDENLDALRHLGWPVGLPEFALRFPPHPAPGPPPRVAIAASSRWPTKNWPVDRFAALAAGLAARGATVVLVGSLADRPVCEEIAARARGGGRVLDWSGRTTLAQLGGMLSACDLAVTVDTGPMHLAAALGVPVLALFGPTDPVRTGPYGPHARTLTCGPLPCRPCFGSRCSRKDLACLTGIQLATVLEAAEEMLARSLQNRRC